MTVHRKKRPGLVNFKAAHIPGVPDLGEVDCSYRQLHVWRFEPHPLTGRLVCGLCHPIPDRARQLAQAYAAAAA